MTVYITGDKHGNEQQLFYSLKKTKPDDVLIITGDFGFNFSSEFMGDFEREVRKENVRFKNFTQYGVDILYVDGNHENFDRLYNYPVIEKYGAPVHEIYPGIYHMIRGNIYSIEGNTFFAFGGAFSHDIRDEILDRNDSDFQEKYREFVKADKMFRINRVSWWEEEVPSEEEIDFAMSNLEKYENKVDYVVTHQAPPPVEISMGYGKRDPYYENSHLFPDFLNYIYRFVKYKKWYCGHYHRDSKINENFKIIYLTTEKIQ